MRHCHQQLSTLHPPTHTPFKTQTLLWKCTLKTWAITNAYKRRIEPKAFSESESEISEHIWNLCMSLLIMLHRKENSLLVVTFKFWFFGSAKTKRCVGILHFRSQMSMNLHMYVLKSNKLFVCTNTAKNLSPSCTNAKI